MQAGHVLLGVGRHARTRRVVGLAATTALVAGTALAGTAVGQHERGHLQCGDVVTFEVSLNSDVGPCPGVGLIIGADNVTLDLNGHSVTGNPQARADRGAEAQDAPGIVFRGVSGSAVRNGTVRDFDAGIVIRGGSGNDVSNVTVRDNINYRILTGVNADPGGPSITDDPPPCDFGDGIAVFNSSGNQIRDSRVMNNGPFSGISLVENSDANLVSRNFIARNNVVNVVREGARENLGERTVCGTATEQGPMTRGRELQDSGVRIEGPGADDNRVQRNEIRESGLTGVSVHGYVCNPPAEGGGDRPPPPAAPNNGGNLVFKNTVTGTGVRGPNGQLIDPIADGIATLQQGPATIVCVAFGNTISQNVSRDNGRDGIFLGGRGSNDNVVINNRVNDNGRDGLHLEGPSTNQQGEVVRPGAINNRLLANKGRSNERFDGFDGNLNPPCDNNMWRGNQFRTVNHPCVWGPSGRPGGRDNDRDNGQL